MKTKPIIRIVLWSISIVLLTTILLASLGIGFRSEANDTVYYRPGQNAAVQPVQQEPTIAPEAAATLDKPATVYSTPSEESLVLTELESGTEVSITRRELINGEEWAFIILPTNGWIPAASLEEENAPVTVTEPTGPVIATCPPAQEAMLTSDSISSLSIEWLSGSVSVIAGTGDGISIVETEGDQPLVWRERNGRLSIDFCEESFLTGFRLVGTKSKDLTVYVPQDWVCQELEIDAGSANLVLQNLTLETVDIDAASGKTEFIECQVDTLEIETASGDIAFVGSLKVLECDAASASFLATLTNTPDRLEMNSASGSMDITLPADAGFTVRMEGLRSIFSSDFPTTVKNGAYVHGDGSCRIELESMSGGVHLRKG